MNKISANNLFKWIIFAGIASLTGLLITFCFVTLIKEILIYTNKNTYTFFFLPLAAPILCKFLAYYYSPESAEEGVLSYLKSVNSSFGDLPFKVTFFKFVACLITLGCNLSGGVVGPLVRVNSGLASFLSKQKLPRRFQLNQDDRRTFVICGAAATVATVFHAPLSSGLFAVEILKRANMRYLDLFPSILTACLTTALAKGLGLPAVFPFHSTNVTFPIKDLIWIVLIGFASGYFSILYVNFYHWVSKTSERKRLRFSSKLIGASLVTLIAFIFSHELLGTSQTILEDLLNGKVPHLPSMFQNYNAVFLGIILLAFLKGITNCLTVGTGFSAGFAGPSVIMGMLIGVSFGHALGAIPLSGSYYGFLAAGMSGVLSASMNVPMAAAAMGAELFGSSIGFSSTISSIVAFQVARSATLYKSQLN